MYMLNGGMDRALETGFCNFPPFPLIAFSKERTEWLTDGLVFMDYWLCINIGTVYAVCSGTNDIPIDAGSSLVCLDTAVSISWVVGLQGYSLQALLQ